MLIFAPNLVPVGSAGGAIACPHRVPRARLPTAQRGRRAGWLHAGPWSVQWPHRPRQSEAQGAGRQPPSCLPSLLRGFAFPPKTCLPLTWTWFKDFLLCSHSIGHRRGASSPACRARCRHPVRQSRRLRRALREEGTHVCVLQERGRRHGVASAPRGPLLAPGCCGPASPLSEAG